MNQSVMNLGLIVVFIAVVYFMMIRPQRKQDKQNQEMRANLKVGDEVMTIGGIMGKVVKVTEKSVVIASGADKCKIEFIKTAIASVGKPQDAPTKSAPAPKEEDEDVKTPDRSKKVTPKKLTK